MLDWWVRYEKKHTSWLRCSRHAQTDRGGRKAPGPAQSPLRPRGGPDGRGIGQPPACVGGFSRITAIPSGIGKKSFENSSHRHGCISCESLIGANQNNSGNDPDAYFQKSRRIRLTRNSVAGINARIPVTVIDLICSLLIDQLSFARDSSGSSPGPPI